MIDLPKLAFSFLNIFMKSNTKFLDLFIFLKY